MQRMPSDGPSFAEFEKMFSLSTHHQQARQCWDLVLHHDHSTDSNRIGELDSILILSALLPRIPLSKIDQNHYQQLTANIIVSNSKINPTKLLRLRLQMTLLQLCKY